MTYQLASVDLGQVKTERHRQFSDLDYQAFPLASSSAAYVFDYQGVKRVITLEGTKHGTTAELEAFLNSIEALQTGNQLSAVVFHSDLHNTNFNVKVDTFISVWEAGTPGKLDYTLTLFEGT